MFRPLEVIIRLALEHFKMNIQIALLEIRSHFLLNAFNVNVCTYIHTYVRVCMYTMTELLTQSPSFDFVHRIIFFFTKTTFWNCLEERSS